MLQGITVRMTAGVCSETVKAKDSALTLKVLKGVYQQPRILYLKKQNLSFKSESEIKMNENKAETSLLVYCHI